MALLWRGGPLAGPNAADSPRACSDDTCTHTPFRLDDLQVLAQLRPTLVPEQDRVGWYLSQWVARAHPPDAPVADPAEPSGFRRFLCVGSGYAPSNTLVDDAAVCLQLARHALQAAPPPAVYLCYSAARARQSRTGTFVPSRVVVCSRKMTSKC